MIRSQKSRVIADGCVGVYASSLAPCAICFRCLTNVLELEILVGMLTKSSNRIMPMLFICHYSRDTSSRRDTSLQSAPTPCVHFHLLTSQSESRVYPPHQHALQNDRAGSDLPFITSISRSLPILMLLLGSHSIPLLRFCVVSPAVVEKCARVLDQLRITISFQWLIFHCPGILGVT
jgi:hypothetical protein